MVFVTAEEGQIVTQALVQALIVSSFLALVANRLVEALIKPIFERFKWDGFWLMYVAWAIAGGLVALTNANIFAAFIPNQVVGRVLTAIVSGGGANLLHDLFDALIGLRNLYQERLEEEQ